ncbi:MAG: hypothetical protein HY898_06295 [Deltaproteobacteria bacterium]|nr:hypothetical protein [Deltaproteobacteria bacterium]
MTQRKASSQDPVTIVGGRPMHRAVEVSQLPTGIEQILTLSALDCSLRDRFAADPIAAAASKGVRLQPTEEALLRQTPAETLRAMAEQAVIPRAMSRRAFVKPVAASIVALITGSAFLLCSGCTGADSWDPDGGEAGTDQMWMQIAGHTCYVYLCAASQQDPTKPVPVLLALHDLGETCLSNVQRWRAAADKYGFNIVSVNWTEEPATQQAKDKLAADLGSILDEFGKTYAITPGYRHLSGRGAATPILWKGAFEGAAHAWRSVVFLGGVPDGDWVGAPETALAKLSSGPPALYYVMGTSDAQLDSAKALTQALSTKGATTKLAEVSGSTAEAVLDFSAIWIWLFSHE